MKSLQIVVLLILTSYSNGQIQRETFQDILNKEAKTRSFKTNGYPYLEFSKANNVYFIFWHKKNTKFYLAFAENGKVFYIIDCGRLPVGTEDIGAISIQDKTILQRLKDNFSFYYVNDDIKDICYQAVEQCKNNTESESELFTGKLENNFLPIKVVLEIPVIFYKVGSRLLILPMER